MSLRLPIRSEAAIQQVQRLDVEYQDLSVQMNSLVAQISANRSRVNTLAPISNLPTEILSHIFSFLSPSRTLALEHFGGTVLPKTHCAWRDWIDVTHVCVHWRRVSIRDPSLWTVIYCKLGPEWTHLMLLRSRSLPISVVFTHVGRGIGRPGLAPTYNEPRVLLIANHRTRIKILKLDAQFIAHDFTFSWMLAQLYGSFPLLEKLELLRGGESIENEVVRIPIQYFCSMPALKVLSLHSVVPFWVPGLLPSFSNLVAFYFVLPDPNGDDMYLDPEAPLEHQDVLRNQLLPTLTQLLDILDAMPVLKYLSLDNTLPKARSAGTSWQVPRVVSLPNLEIIDLSGCIHDCTSFADYLDFPCTTYVGLKGNLAGPDGNSDDFPLIGPFLERHISRQRAESRTIDRVFFLIITSQLSLTLDVGSKAIFSLDVPCFLTAQSLELDFLRNAFATMPMADNASFEFVMEWQSGTTPYDAAIFEEIFGQPSLASVSSVKLESNTLYPLCPALSKHMPDSRFDDYLPPEHLRSLNVFPGLEDVILECIDCRDMDADELMGLQDEIVNVIRTREQGGTPLRSVKICECDTIPLEWLESLKACFPELRDVTLNKTDCRNMAADELMGLRDEIINVIRTLSQSNISRDHQLEQTPIDDDGIDIVPTVILQ
ncbi:hypothetical protein EVG20_g2155 [Dentipellis fragilis]|uniref:F-box domain-containing protein n=1 Tax=Dentipellis fragilis TaxID=205917 RepID=A0A4Y9ZBS9_9AGAM|nr:hypothetical protein EVG20_g2155 [Dentipellis fragilis]